MRVLKLLAVGCMVGVLGCGGDNGASTPPPGVDSGTTDVQIDMGEAELVPGSDTTQGDAMDMGSMTKPEGDETGGSSTSEPAPSEPSSP